MFTAETSENEEKGIKIRSRAKVVKSFGNFSIATEFVIVTGNRRLENYCIGCTRVYIKSDERSVCDLKEFVRTTHWITGVSSDI